MVQKGLLHFFAFVILALTLVKATASEPRYFMDGDDVVLPCKVQMGQPPLVTWYDSVFSDGGNITIFELNRGSTKKNPAHVFVEKFKLDPIDLALTITEVNGDFSGFYTCSSKVADVFYNVSYYISVYGKFTCDLKEKSHFIENETSDFHCSVQFQGDTPAIKWTLGNSVIPKEMVTDKDDVGLANQSFTHQFTSDDDGKMVQCMLDLNTTKEECHVVLNVTYPTRKVHFVPDKHNFTTGESVKCVADGNPRPAVLMHAEGDGVEKWKGMGNHEVVLKVPEAWVDKTVHIHCLAENAKKASISKRTNIHVSAPHTGPLKNSSPGNTWSLLLLMNGMMAILISCIHH